MNRRKSISGLLNKTPTKSDSKINLRYISGPISWTGFEFGNKSIHLFGDYHFSFANNCEDYGIKCSDSNKTYPNSNCMTIDGLIKNIFYSQDKMNFVADFFLEITQETKKKDYIEYNKEEENRVGYIKKLYNNLKSNKSNFHGIDIRTDFDLNRSNQIEIDIFTIIFSVIQRFIYYTKTRDDFLNILYFGYDMYYLLKDEQLEYNKASDLTQFFLQLKDQLTNQIIPLRESEGVNVDIYKFLVGKIETVISNIQRLKLKNDKYVSKLFYNLDSLSQKNITFQGVNITQYINQFIEQKRNLFLSQIENTLEKMSQLVELDDSQFYVDYELINDLAEYFVHNGALTMDGFLFAKLFKRLQEEKNKDQKQIIIIYAGDFHNNHYIEFFTKILNLKPIPEPILSLYSNQNKELFRCLDNPNFGFIFSKWIDKTIYEEDNKSDKNTKQTKLDNYILKKQIGSGKYGTVYLGLEKETNEKVAIKILKLSDPKIFERETKCLNKIFDICKSVDVICLKDAFVEGDKYYIITPYLEDYKQLSDYKITSQNEVDIIMNKILEIVNQLKQIGVDHGDLGLDNIMIKNKNGRLEIKLIDFGLCSIFGDPETPLNNKYSQEERLLDLREYLLDQTNLNIRNKQVAAYN